MLQSFPVVQYYAISRIGGLEKSEDLEALGRIESEIRATSIKSLLRRGGDTKGILLSNVIEGKSSTLALLTGCQTNVLSVPTDSGNWINCECFHVDTYFIHVVLIPGYCMLLGLALCGE